jgi:hypothetical protein
MSATPKERWFLQQGLTHGIRATRASGGAGEVRGYLSGPLTFFVAGVQTVQGVDSVDGESKEDKHEDEIQV